MRRIFTVLTAAAGAVLLIAAPALAQEVPDLPTVPEPPVPVPGVPGTVPPPPELPAVPVPPGAEPALVISAPLSNEACALASTATSNAAKVPLLIALGLTLAHGPAIEAIPSTSPYFTLPTRPCMGLTAPTRLSECAGDREAAGLLEVLLGLPGLSATGAVFGLTGIRVELPRTGAVLDVVAAAEETGPAAGLPPLSADDSVYEALDCEDVLDASFAPPMLSGTPSLRGAGGPHSGGSTAGSSPVQPVPGSSSGLGAVAPGPARPSTAVGIAPPAASEAAAPPVAGDGGPTSGSPSPTGSGSSPWQRGVQALAVALLAVAVVNVVQTERRPKRP